MNTTTGKPATQPQPVDPGVIPGAMRAAKRWLLHDSKKIPYYASGTRRAGKLNSPRDLARLVTFAEAVEALAKFTEIGMVGLGFALGEGWQGCDLDKVRGEDGGLAPWAAELIEKSATYAEISPSGKGVHLIFFDVDAEALTLGANGSGIEFYSTARYFTLTGNALNGTKLRPFKAVLDLMTRQHITQAEAAQRAEAKTPSPIVPGVASPEWDGFAHELRQGLPHVPAGRGRERWRNIGMGIHLVSGGNEEGYKIWRDWSRDYHGGELSEDGKSVYNEEHCRYQWDRFKPDPDPKKRVNWGTVKMYLDEFAPKKQEAPAADGSLVAWLKAWKPHDPQAVTPVSFYVDGLIEEKRAVGLVAPGGTGKTTALMQLGIATALGTDWFGMAVKAGSFVLLSLDDLQEDLEGTLEAMMYGLTKAQQAQVRSRVRLYSLLDYPGVVPGFAQDEYGAIVETQLRQWLTEGLADVPELRCIVLDTARQFSGGDTNNGRVMSIITRAVAAIARARSCCVVLPHHMTKQGARELAGGAVPDQYAGTGSAAFGDNLRVILVLYRAEIAELDLALELSPLEKATLHGAELLKLVDTRGSLRRKAIAPVWIARHDYRLWRIGGRVRSGDERHEESLRRVIEAVRAGATSVDQVRSALKMKKARAEVLVHEALACGRLSKTHRTGGLKVV